MSSIVSFKNLIRNAVVALALLGLAAGSATAFQPSSTVIAGGSSHPGVYDGG